MFSYGHKAIKLNHQTQQVRKTCSHINSEMEVKQFNSH